jgi:O-Glycosyl hydrolase
MKRRLTRRALVQNGLLVASGAVSSFAMGVRAFVQNSAPLAATWISTTEKMPWQERKIASPGWRWDTLDVVLKRDGAAQTIDGFGGCFNELGWVSLNALAAEDRDAVMKELFAPGVGANFTICRMPVGANDFSRDWYSYDETPGDLALEHFGIANDLETLVPFIKAAQRYNPGLRLWASPWSPPSWMKTNKHYAAAMSRPGAPENGLKADQVGKEGTDLFIQEEPYFAAYAKYFGRFIEEYRKQGISIGMVMPQNEFNSAQPFPSCTWTPQGLAKFLRHLGPEMDRRKVEVFFGTLERGDVKLLSDVMGDPAAGKWINGVGVQWAGKGAVADVPRKYPALTIYQSEQECGDGKNSWAYASYCWELMKHYFRSGANGYMYWNLSLQEGGESRWGWKQNSLVTVDLQTKKYSYNHEYYVLKHVSHFVKPGAKRLQTEGTEDNALGFVNPDGSSVVVMRNEAGFERPVRVTVDGHSLVCVMEPDSLNTVVVGKA